MIAMSPFRIMFRTVRWVAPLVKRSALAFRSPIVTVAPRAGWITTFCAAPSLDAS